MTQPQSPLISANSGPGENTTRPSIWRPALREAGAIFFISAALWAALYAAFFFDFHPEFERFANRGDTPELTFQGQQFVPVQAGNGGYKDGAAVITEYQGGAAILEIRQPFIAEDYPFIQFDVQGLTTWSEAFVFWQQTEAPGVIHRLQLQRQDDKVNQVAMVYGGTGYRGEISTLAIGFLADPTGNDNGGEPVTLIEAKLLPFNAERVLRQIFEGWRNPPIYRGYANNMVIGAAPNALLRPNPVIYLLIVTSPGLLLAWTGLRRVVSRTITPLLPKLLLVCLFAMSLSIVIRIPAQLQLHDDHIERYAGRSLAERTKNHPIRCNRQSDCFSNLQPYF